MLIINRKHNERFRIQVPGHPDIWVRYIGMNGVSARIGIEAPRYISVTREEVLSDVVVTPAAPTRNE